MQSEQVNNGKEIQKLISFFLSKRARRVVDTLKEPIKIPKGRKKKS